MGVFFPSRCTPLRFLMKLGGQSVKQTEVNQLCSNFGITFRPIKNQTNCAFSFPCLRKLAAKVIRNVSSYLVSLSSAVVFTGMISISSFFLGSKCEEHQSNFETEHKKTHKKTQTKQNIINYLTAL